MIGTLQSGGVSKSLVNLLNTIDRQRYDVHLLVMSFEGTVYDQFLPTDITLHEDANLADLHNGVAGLRSMLRRGRWLLMLGSMLRMVLSLFNKAWAARWMAHLMPAIEGEFDLIVDYDGQQLLSYMVDKLRGRRLLTFFHSDYSQWAYYYAADKLYYPKVDAIYTISEQCVEALRDYFPDCAHKVHLMENINSPQLINELAQAKTPAELASHLTSGTPTFLTIGHVQAAKGTDIALEAAIQLKAKGVRFHWYFLGKLADEQFAQRVQKEGLSDVVTFLGIRSNPYPYIQAATLIVHPSRFEGKSIALDEAKILCKPIVVTRFSTVHNQFADGINATICEMNGTALATAIGELLTDVPRQQQYIEYLRAHIADNSSEIKKVYAWL